MRFLLLAVLVLSASPCLAGVKAPDKTHVKGDPRAALRNLGKLKRPQSMQKLSTKPARTAIDKVTK